MPWASYPIPPYDPTLDQVAAALDPILIELHFAAGQTGGTDVAGQVIFCRGYVGSVDGSCVDLVVDLATTAGAGWRITDVRYAGFTSRRMHLAFDRDTDLRSQLQELARTLPDQLSPRST